MMCMACAFLGWPLAVVGLAWLGFRFFEWKNLYYPTTKIEVTPQEFGLDYEDVVFVSEEGNQLHGWWIPHPAARGTILYCHGNAGNIGDRVWLAADLHQLAVNVFLFDYRGYGESKGLPTERGTYSDARAAFEVVRARHGDQEKPPVIVYGQSLGGAIAIQLALDKPACGLVVESTFTSVPDMARAMYPRLPLRAFIRYRYDSGAKAPHLAMPKLFCHSPDDELIPFEMGRTLFEAAVEPKEFVELSGLHNESGWNRSPHYGQAIERFIDRVFSPA